MKWGRKSKIIKSDGLGMCQEAPQIILIIKWYTMQVYHRTSGENNNKYALIWSTTGKIERK